ncbi:hypothetical protein LSAT2_026570 [Lamellibrachia satsuma]|nr:hypothetical protein LSAT2_026570 [Lamellibrachia satsuma]
MLAFCFVYDSGVWQPVSVVGHGYRRRSWRSYGFGSLGYGFDVFDQLNRSAACIQRGGVYVEKSSCLQYTRFLSNGTFVCCPLNPREYQVYYIRKVVYPRRRRYGHRRPYRRRHYIYV